MRMQEKLQVMEIVFQFCLVKSIPHEDEIIIHPDFMEVSYGKDTREE